jgi:hypothetical protein
MINDKYIENIKRNYDGVWVGDARNRFVERDGKIEYIQTGKDIHGKPFERVLGNIGFLLEMTPQTGVPRVELRDSPARTDDWTDVLFGMIEGRTNVEALGVARVTEVTRNGRGKVLTLWGEELNHALAELGYDRICRDEYTVEAGFVKSA